MSVTFAFWPLLHSPRDFAVRRPVDLRRTPYGVSGISFVILSYLRSVSPACAKFICIPYPA